MYADISRESFEYFGPYSGVVLQQGRVQLDSEANEAAAITRLYQRMAIQHIVGQAAGVYASHPENGGPFKIRMTAVEGPKPGVVWEFSGGVYYVDGMMITHGPDVTSLSEQPFGHLRANELPPEKPKHVLFCLQVWEELVTAAENHSIMDVAVPTDTAARLAIRWRVVHFTDKLPGSTEALKPSNVDTEFTKFRLRELLRMQSRMRARCVSPPTDAGPCLIAPESKFRGDENQLYRVEIHSAEPGKQPTFKFSRENGSVVFPVAHYDGNNSVTLTSLGRDAKLSLRAGDWIQIDDDASKCRREPALPPLRQIESINSDSLKLTLSAVTAGSTVGTDPSLNPVLRRWDHSFGDKPPTPDGALPLTQGDSEDSWLDLEEGIQVQFPSQTVCSPREYWFIAARPAIGDIIWPAETVSGAHVPIARSADGPRISYAALEYHDDGVVDKRRLFTPISKPATEFTEDTGLSYGDLIVNLGWFQPKQPGYYEFVQKPYFDPTIREAAQEMVTQVEKVNPIAEKVNPITKKVDPATVQKVDQLATKTEPATPQKVEQQLAAEADPAAAASKLGKAAQAPSSIGRVRPTTTQPRPPDAGGATPTAHT